jgi:hypothetical protein
VTIKLLDRSGIWIYGRTWSFSYWTPWTWKPFSVRHGYIGRTGWWGAASFSRRDP